MPRASEPSVYARYRRTLSSTLPTPFFASKTHRHIAYLCLLPCHRIRLLAVSTTMTTTTTVVSIAMDMGVAERGGTCPAEAHPVVQPAAPVPLVFRAERGGEVSRARGPPCARFGTSGLSSSARNACLSYHVVSRHITPCHLRGVLSCLALWFVVASG